MADRPLVVFTSAFEIERYLTHIYDIAWGREIPIVRGMVAVAALLVQARFGLLTWPLTLASQGNALGATAAVFIIGGVNYAIWRLIGKPKVQGRMIWWYLASQVHFWAAQPPVLVGLCERVRERPSYRERLESWSERTT
jgi:hypothetical protein